MCTPPGADPGFFNRLAAGPGGRGKHFLRRKLKRQHLGTHTQSGIQFCKNGGAPHITTIRTSFWSGSGLKPSSPFRSEICFTRSHVLLEEPTTNHTSSCNQIRTPTNIPSCQELLQIGMLYHHQLST